METRSSKRRRADDTEHDEPEPITRSKYWFPDGNIVLHVEQTQFRVHSSMLARHSVVFQDMLAIPQPSSHEGPLVEGCPVVALSDRAEDVERVLSIFYDNIKVYNKVTLVPLPYVAAMLRLGRKYEIDYLSKEALRLLRADFPAKHTSWNPEAKTRIHSSVQWFTVHVINLAHEFSLDTLLPAMYLSFIHKFPLDELVVNGDPALAATACSRMILGRQKFILRLSVFYKSWKEILDTGTYPECRNPTKCLANRGICLDELGLWTTSTGEISGLPVWKKPDKSLCTSCMKVIRAAFDDVREGMWAELPSIFGLPGWEELKDDIP